MIALQSSFVYLTPHEGGSTMTHREEAQAWFRGLLLSNTHLMLPLMDIAQSYRGSCDPLRGTTQKSWTALQHHLDILAIKTVRSP